MMHEQTEADSESLRARRCIEAVVAHGSEEVRGAGRLRGPQNRRRRALIGALAGIALGLGYLGISQTLKAPGHERGSRAYSKQENSLMSNMSKNLAQKVSGGAMALAVLAAAVPAGDACAQSAIEWRVADGGNGHWYGAISSTDAVGWTDSSSRASQVGGHLVTVHSIEEEDVIWALASDAALWNGRCGPWIGLSQAANPSEPLGGWAWVSGEPLAWSNGTGWADECAWCCGGSTENAAHYFNPQLTGPLRVWNDLPSDVSCSTTYPMPKAFLIEWSADCNSDGIVDYGQIAAGELADANANNIPDCCEAGTPCEVNLIHNGSFELGPAQADCQWVLCSVGSTAISQWMVSEGNVDRMRDSPACPVNIESWNPYEGEHTIDLSGIFAAGSIAQTVPTIPSGNYRLTFQLTGNCVPGVKRMSAEIEGASTEFEHVCASDNPQPWNMKTAHFVAADSETTITLRSLDSGSNGPVIDDVRLVAVAIDPCSGDIDSSGFVNSVDLAMILTVWGTSGGSYPSADIDHDGIVAGADLGIMLTMWGNCP